MQLSRRNLLASGSAVALVGQFRPAFAQRAEPLLNVSTRILDVNGKAAKVFSIVGKNGGQGIIGREGDRFSGEIHNQTGDGLIMHWHGQTEAPAGQDRSRPNGGMLANGDKDAADFLLTPGTHWMHSHQLTEQQLLAAPMIAREKNAGDIQDIVMMLHDFSFRTPEEILAGLGGSAAHGSTSSASAHGGMPMPPANMPGHMMPGQSMAMGGMGNMAGMGQMPGMQIHANDVTYDAFLANDRTLADPDIVRVERGAQVRLRIINGATATAFFVDTGALNAQAIAVDGSPCLPLQSRRFPIAQGQRIDLAIAIPQSGGAFPVFAQVEADRRRTGIVLATAGAQIAKFGAAASDNAGNVGLTLDENLRAENPLAAKKPDRTFTLMLGEEPGYGWTINGRRHGQHAPLDVRKGERIEIAFMNPTSMMHPMHLHGHHFQVVASRTGRFSGPMRDTVIVPPHQPVVVAFDARNAGEWYLHCHHLYHMAAGMMTEVRIGA